MKDITRELYVIALTEKGVQCAVDATTKDAFWLPRLTHVSWKNPPVIGKPVVAIIPGMVRLEHRQLVGDAAFESEKRRDEPAAPTKERWIGALSKNDRKEKDTHPDYKGSIVIDGQKYWLDGWIKDGQNGKFLSLSAKAAD